MSTTTSTGAACVAERAGWPMQRILFLMAGTVTVVGVALAALFSRWYLLIPALVGANQLLMVATGWCPMSLLLTRLGLASAENESVPVGRAGWRRL
jgi:hypothetical protein